MFFIRARYCAICFKFFFVSKQTPCNGVQFLITETEAEYNRNNIREGDYNPKFIGFYCFCNEHYPLALSFKHLNASEVLERLRIEYFTKKEADDIL